MAGKQVTGDGLSANLAGMSKNQLYDIMSQMKTLIEQNQQQARQILIQNPLLTKALFQAQIMLGMVQPPESIPNIQPATSQHPKQVSQPVQQSTIQSTPSLPNQTGMRDQTNAPQSSTPLRNQQQNQTAMPLPSTSVPPPNQSLPSHPLQSVQPPRAHHNAQTTPMPLPQSSQILNMAPLPLHSVTQPSLLQSPMPAASTPMQQSLQTSNIPHMGHQPPLPSQPRPPSVQAFPHQNYSHMGPNASFQHPGASQLHHSQPIPMFHSGTRPPSMGPSFSQGQPLLPNQPLPQSLYQGGGSHLGMEFNQMRSSTQAERGSAWMPGLQENTTAPSPLFLPGQMGSGSQPPRPPPFTPDMEKALLQQVISLTPEQINMLPPEQRNQVLQLQQMLRQ